MRTPYIDLIQVADTAVSCCDCDILQLYIHAIFRCSLSGQQLLGEMEILEEQPRTFEELATIDLPRIELKGNDVAL